MANLKEQAYIYGKHAVKEALAHVPDAVRHLYFIEGHTMKELVTEAKEKKIPFDRCDEEHIPQEVERHSVHQGVIALVAPHRIVRPYKEFIDGLEVTNDTALVVLNELHDPQNVGAIVRSAAAFGVAGVLIPEHRQAPVTGTVVKVSAGMAFVVPIISVGNINTVLRDLKNKGFWIYGLTGEGDTSLADEQFTKPSVFVFGNEGRGMREKTEETCDFRLSIPIAQDVESLNVASSAAVTLYAWRLQHRGGTEYYTST